MALRLWALAGALLCALAIGYLQVRPRLQAARERAQQHSTTAAIREHMLQLGNAADRFFAEHPARNDVTGKELRALAPAAVFHSEMGEDYDAVVIQKSTTLLRIHLPDGKDIVVPRSPAAKP